jgi:predicted phage gp36 major capsid-like protein
MDTESRTKLEELEKQVQLIKDAASDIRNKQQEELDNIKEDATEEGDALGATIEALDTVDSTLDDAITALTNARVE